LKYFLSFKIFEQLALALKTEFALNFSSRGAAAGLKNRTPPRRDIYVGPHTFFLGPVVAYTLC